MRRLSTGSVCDPQQAIKPILTVFVLLFVSTAPIAAAQEWKGDTLSSGRIVERTYTCADWDRWYSETFVALRAARNGELAGAVEKATMLYEGEQQIPDLTSGDNFESAKLAANHLVDTISDLYMLDVPGVSSVQQASDYWSRSRRYAETALTSCPNRWREPR